VRSRPKVSVYAAKRAVPGEKLGVELVLASKSETPVDFIETKLIGNEHVTVGAGRYQSTHATETLSLAAREGPQVLSPGEHRYRYTFDVPRDATPSYLGGRCSATYGIAVHVSVPWWPDRHAAFAVPMVALPSTTPLELKPSIVSSSDGPQPGQVYVEATIDRSVLEPGGEIAGAVSVSNTAAHRIRRVIVSLVSIEWTREPRRVLAAGTRLSAILVDGTPPEGEPSHFKLRVPEVASPTLRGRSFTLDWQLEVRVDLAFSEDLLLHVPLVVKLPPPGEPPRAPGRYHAIGRDRFGLVWAAVATKLGMTLDEDGQTLRSAANEASLAVRRTHGAKAYALSVELGWPKLGIDLHVTERSWTDIVQSSWQGPSAAASKKLVILGREPEQLAALFDGELLDILSQYASVAIEDEHARLTLPVAGTNTGELERACRSALALLARFAAWPVLVPPPRTMTTAVDAWRAFSERTGGALEIGSLSAKGCAIGVDRFSVETLWLATDHPLATVVTFPFDPPFETEPQEDAASLSAATRELLRTVTSQTSHLEITKERLSWREEGSLSDPSVLMPKIELAARLVRGLRGRPMSGPYR
jgi:hypothetical protein